MEIQIHAVVPTQHNTLYSMYQQWRILTPLGYMRGSTMRIPTKGGGCSCTTFSPIFINQHLWLIVPRLLLLALLLLAFFTCYPHYHHLYLLFFTHYHYLYLSLFVDYFCTCFFELPTIYKNALLFRSRLLWHCTAPPHLSHIVSTWTYSQGMLF